MKTNDEYDFGKGVRAKVFRDATRKRSPDHVRQHPEDRWVELTYNNESLAIPLDAVASIISGLEWLVKTEAEKGKEEQLA